MAVMVVACGGSTVDPEAVAQISADLRASGAGPGVAPGEGFTLEQRMAHWSVPGASVAVVDGGRVIWARGFGVKEAGTSDSVTASTVFQAASVSKPVAVTGMLRMVDEGRLDLDQPVYGYLESWTIPEGRQTEESPVTLRRIASHSAGFTVHGFPGYRAGEPIPTVQHILNGEAPANTPSVRINRLPGEAFSYSGGGFTVMQLIMSDIADAPFLALMKRLVLDPVAMERSTYEQPLPSGWSGDAASGHTSDGEVVQGRWHTYPEMAAAGLWTTPTDLLKWAITIAAVREGRSGFLSRNLAVEMLTPRTEDMGLGIVLEGSDRTFRFGHSGSNVGYRSRVVYYPTTGQGAAMLTNGNQGAELASEMFAAFAEVFAWPAETDERR